MKRLRHSDKLKGVPADLERLASRLEEPHSSSTGLTFPDIELPRSIRMFLRTKIGYGTESRKNMNLVKHVLIVNLRGEGVVFLDEIPVQFSPGEVLVIRPDQFHHYSRRDDLAWLFAGFELTGNMLASFAQHGPLPLVGEEWDYVRQAMTDYSRLTSVNSKPGKSKKNDAGMHGGRIAVMLWLLLLNLAERQRERLGTDVRGANGEIGVDVIIKKAQAYILEHLNHSIHVRDVAHHAGVSPSRLCQVFKLNVGHPLGRSIRRLRVNRAAMLLASSGMGIKEISSVCGFSSLSAFCRTFLLMTGLTPKSYRAIYGKMGGGSRRPENPAGQGKDYR